MKRCKSVNRAMRRGHSVDFFSGTYSSKKEHRILFEKWVKEQLKQATKEGLNNGETN